MIRLFRKVSRRYANRFIKDGNQSMHQLSRNRSLGGLNHPSAISPYEWRLVNLKSIYMIPFGELAIACCLSKRIIKEKKWNRS
jgi:hypothetical protein